MYTSGVMRLRTLWITSWTKATTSGQDEPLLIGASRVSIKQVPNVVRELHKMGIALAPFLHGVPPKTKRNALGHNKFGGKSLVQVLVNLWRNRAATPVNKLVNHLPLYFSPDGTLAKDIRAMQPSKLRGGTAITAPHVQRVTAMACCSGRRTA